MNRVVEYGYDSVGNKAFEKVGGEVLGSSYWYDALNRLTTVEDSKGLLTHYTYNDDSNEKATTKHDGSEIIEVLDGIDNTVKKIYKSPSTLWMTVIKEESFYHDDELNITKESVKEIESNKTQETNYTYDELGRKLTEVSTVNSNTAKKVERKYKYDNNDNVVSTWFEDYSDENNPVKSRTNTSFDNVDREIGESTSKTQLTGKTVSPVTTEGNATTFNDQENKMVVQNEAGPVSVESDSGDRVKKITSLEFYISFK